MDQNVELKNVLLMRFSQLIDGTNGVHVEQGRYRVGETYPNLFQSQDTPYQTLFLKCLITTSFA